VPIAEIVPISSERKTDKRPLGLAQDEFEIPPSFFDNLPEDVINSVSTIQNMVSRRFFNLQSLFYC
jgi:antitoxin (DNA-binding transcriptional repressor) of toxin-antitoxin stability system